MEASILSFLTGFSSKIFWFAATVFLVVNGAAIVAFTLSRSRRMVDAWTGKLVVADAALVGAGLGLPLLAGLAKIGVHAVAAMFGGAPTPDR